jgi:hypothetical protein
VQILRISRPGAIGGIATRTRSLTRDRRGPAIPEESREAGGGKSGTISRLTLVDRPCDHSRVVSAIETESDATDGLDVTPLPGFRAGCSS